MRVCSQLNCNKPVYIESNGHTHPFCGKTCAGLARLAAVNTIGKCSSNFCCRPKYKDDSGNIYDYCGRTCAIKSSAIALEKENQSPRNVSEEQNLCKTKCSRTDCSKKRYIDPNNPTKFFSFCNRKCYWTEINSLTTTKITLVSKKDLDYDRISEGFMKVLPNIQIQAILRLQMAKQIVEAHLEFRKKKKYVHQMYHGTSASCNIKNLIKNQTLQCNSLGVGVGGIKACGICGILREGNSTKHSNYNGQMWFARQPSISIQYTSGEYKGIFCVDVATDDNNNNYTIIDSNAASLARFLVIFK
ncbi:hypothetical protein Glove_103g217 [Diversispora epigaea]|uniref:PARP catalytic domain-containing protein n=1 Tax=Diversispora epigaea TaxID=1348612 RepID=A0A397JCA2_9GLOM|nr:hypothetical protein Glove_103g217 [Diversispora epigaea]